METQTKSSFKPATIKLKGKDYLEVAQRIAWFRATHGDNGAIDTEATILGELALIKARVLINGVQIASGMATVREYKQGGADRSIEKAETAAIGRALGVAGYGTLEAGDDFEEGEYLADSPQPAVDVEAAKDTFGSGARNGKPRKIETRGTVTISHLDLQETQSGKKMFVAETDGQKFYSFTRQPFRDVEGMTDVVETWTEINKRYTFAPMVIEWCENNSNQRIIDSAAFALPEAS